MQLKILFLSIFISLNGFSQKTFSYKKGVAGYHFYPIKTTIGRSSLWVSVHNYVNVNIIDGSYSDLKISLQNKNKSQRFYYNYYFRYFYGKNKIGSYLQLRAKI